MPVNAHQVSYYKDKLQYEIDSWDLHLVAIVAVPN